METHLKAQEQKLLQQIFKGQVCYSPTNSRSCGVMIGMAPRFPWILSHIIIDQEGRYVITKGKVNSHELIIAEVYAPHKQVSLLGFFGKLLQIGGKEIVLLGGFIAAFNNELDQSKESSTSGLPTNFNYSMNMLHLVGDT